LNDKKILKKEQAEVKLDGKISQNIEASLHNKPRLIPKSETRISKVKAKQNT
jgi:hypothetical protein